MPLEIVMPKLGLTMTEGLIVEWKFKEGDKVKKGDILFLLETEKVCWLDRGHTLLSFGQILNLI